MENITQLVCKTINQNINMIVFDFNESLNV